MNTKPFAAFLVGCLSVCGLARAAQEPVWPSSEELMNELSHGRGDVQTARAFKTLHGRLLAAASDDLASLRAGLGAHLTATQNPHAARRLAILLASRADAPT